MFCQVLFLRDTASSRLTPDGPFQPSDAALPVMALDDSQLDHGEMQEHCDHHRHEAHGHSHAEHFAWLLDTRTLGPKALVPLLLTVVLSVHSFIAGMALGVEESDTAAVPTLIAILAHKWVEAISLGVSVVRVTPDRRVLVRCAAAVCVLLALSEFVAILMSSRSECSSYLAPCRLWVSLRAGLCRR